VKGNMSQTGKPIDLSSYVQKARTVNGQALDDNVQIDNVASADKLKTARNISLSGAVKSTPTAFDGSADVDVPITKILDSYVEWGG
jgi:hypothetical protein